jgi:uncharacterized protein YukE
MSAPGGGLHVTTPDLAVAGKLSGTVSVEIDQLRMEITKALGNLEGQFVGQAKTGLDGAVEGWLQLVGRVVSAFEQIGVEVTNVGMETEQDDATNTALFTGLTTTPTTTPA